MFLKEVIKDICANDPKWDNMVLILPSNRSIREFKHHLFQEINTPVFSPKFYTIESFIEEISGLRLCDSLNLQLWFHSIFSNNVADNKEDYTSYSAWANSVLSDFNEIDRYLIPPEEIFGYLSAISKIKNWSPNQEPTSLISEYTKFVNSLGQLYSKLNEFLFAKGLGYQGMLYRHAAKNIDSYLKDRNQKNYKIISLNALNNSEKTILNKLLDIPTTKIYWDIDNLFLNDKLHSAGYFIRQNLSYFKNYTSKMTRFSNNELLSEKAIQITGVPKNISQAKYVGQLLQSINFKKGPVALVLADETLLPAILNSIPEIDAKVNITMGYPVKSTQTYMFLKSVLGLMSLKPDSDYYYKDVQRVLNNPILSCLINLKVINSLNEEIRRNNTIYITKERLQKLLTGNEKLKKSIEQPSSLLEGINNLVQLFSQLIEKEKLKFKKIELESCALIITALSEVRDSLSKLTHKFSFKDFDVLIDTQLQEKTITFKGNPNDGLQIMGLLETRGLDFETVLMTSVNEGVIPAGKSFNSFIPYDVKHEFALPTIKEKDAVYTYHFYRLLQRPKNVHLIYNTEPDVLKGGEPSRFIHQLTTHEQLNTFVKHTLSSPKIPSNKSAIRKVEKTTLLAEHLKMMAEKGFSPSSLTQYIRNPFDFYKRYVLGIETPEMVEEDVRHNILGSIIHDSLEQLYEKLQGQKLTPELLSGSEQNIEKIIFSQFEKYHAKNSICQGKNLILFEVVKKYIRGVISYDKAISKNQELKIIGLEQKLSLNIKLRDGTSVILKGKLDRIDTLDGQLRILDYKTGKVEKSGLNLTDFDELFSDKKYEKAFQLLCYALLYYQNENKLPEQVAILPIKQIKQGHIPLKVDKSSMLSKESLESFLLGLKFLIEEILNPDIPFTEKVD